VKEIPMKTIALFATSAALIGLAACTPPTDKYGHWGKQAQPMKVASKLDCPDEKGQLKRTAAAPDGRSCTYADDQGSTVELKLVEVKGDDAKAALAPIEASIRAMVPITPKAEEDMEGAADAASSSTPAAATAKATTAAAAPTAAGPSGVSMHPAGAKLPNGRTDDNDEVHINLPGIHINATNDSANVRIAGIHVDADDAHDNVHVENAKGHLGIGGNFTVDANNGGAVIRSEKNDANIRSTFIVASDDKGPAGKKAAGYVARGPRSGPLVVAVVQIANDDSDHHDGVFGDATHLVKLNTGGK
jgi:hypothetical protein